MQSVESQVHTAQSSLNESVGKQVRNMGYFTTKNDILTSNVFDDILMSEKVSLQSYYDGKKSEYSERLNDDFASSVNSDIHATQNNLGSEQGSLNSTVSQKRDEYSHYKNMRKTKNAISDAASGLSDFGHDIGVRGTGQFAVPSTFWYKKGD